MRIRDILRSKGSDVVTVDPGRTVLEAMRTLVDHNIGSVVVVEEDDVRGILTERDVLRLGADDPATLGSVPVREAMTEDLVIGELDDRIDYVMEIMTNNRVRHLPILERGELRGIVSIGDVVKASKQNAEAENKYLRDYIKGETR